jgi:hypothetical protein
MPVVAPVVTDAQEQPVSNSFTFDDSVGFTASATVFVRQHWGDNWTQNDQLVCTSLNWAAAPTVPTATLVYRYGNAIERDGSVGVRSKLTLGGWYVKIVVECDDGERKWHGYVDDTADAPNGFVGTDPTGTQTFSCVGMIAALDRSPIGSCNFLLTLKTGLSAPHFNPKSKISDERGHVRQIKNKVTDFLTVDGPFDVPDFTTSTTPTYPATLPDPARTSYLFHCEELYSSAAATVDYWTSKDILQYLVAYHAPRDRENEEKIPVWVYDPENQLPTYDNPELNCDGLTLKQSLDRLLSLKNSLGYWCWVDDPTNRVIIQPFTALESSLTVSTGNTLPANSRWLNVHVSSDPASGYTIQRSESALANQVVVNGAKRIAITTLRILSSSSASASALTPGWSSTEQTAFLTEFPTALTGAATLREQYAARDALEQGKYKNVFRNFVLGPSWSFKVGTTWGTESTLFDLFRNDIADCYGVHTADNARYYPYPFHLKILPNLPLKDGVDYSDPLFSLDDIQENHLESTKPFRKIEVYGRSHAHGFTGGAGAGMTGQPTIWTHRTTREIHYDIADPDYSLDVHPLPSDQGIGVAINVVGASQTIFSNQNPAPHIPRLPIESLDVTLAMEEDRQVSQCWPAIASVGTSIDGVLRKVFNFGEAFQLIEMLEGTTIGITATDFVRSPSRYFVRDDRPKMLELAKQLHKWYSTARNVVRISSRRMTARIWPGQLIKQVNPSTGHAATSNCVITEVSIQLPIGTPQSPGKPTLSIVTSRGEIDPLFFNPKLG